MALPYPRNMKDTESSTFYKLDKFPSEYGEHEAATEKFYEVGVHNFKNYHDRYLNFGLWENGITDYVAASENLLSRVADKISLNQESVLLDVACGMGTQDFFFLKKYRCSLIEALDLTYKHIEIAQQHNQHKEITFIQGNACALPYVDEVFSHVIGIEGPANFNTREAFFKEAYRVLRPGGKLGLSDYCLAREPKGWWERFLVKKVSSFWHMPQANVQTKEAFKETLERCGFTNVEIEAVTDSVIPGYIAENKKPESRKEVYRIRGWLWGRLSDYLDDFVGWLHKKKLVDYVLVKAEKPL